MDFDLDAIPEWLRRRRHDEEMSMEEAARTLGVSLRSYQTWEAGKGLPRLEQFARIVKRWGLPGPDERSTAR